MARSVKEIMAQAEELAGQFEKHEPTDGVRDARSLRDIREAFVASGAAQRRLVDAISVARAEGHSWAAIGAMVGTSGEAARQRFQQALHSQGR